MKEKESLFVFAGEPSGDLHGKQLIAKLKQTFPKLEIFGVGGPLMRQAGLTPLLPMEKFQVMGFVDVLIALPRLLFHFFFLRKAILQKDPKAVLLIDYPGFNLALAKSLVRKGYQGKICQYICPSVWAWNKKRIPKMEHSLDHLFTILPFEPKLFDAQKLHAQFVGHPLIHRAFLPKPIYVPQDRRPIVIFPGSRLKELERNLPLQLQAGKQLLKEFPNLYFLVSAANPSFTSLINKIAKQSKLPVALEENTEGLMRIAECAIATSGTVALELALQKVPTVVTYGIAPLDLFIAKYILKIRLPYYCLVNILAQASIFPELIGPHFTLSRLCLEMRHFLLSQEACRHCREKCEEIAKMLGTKEPEQEIIEVIKTFI